MIAAQRRTTDLLIGAGEEVFLCPQPYQSIL
jgi:hypothetical protein